MHRALAKHPMLQVRLFLLMDELVHTELLCMNAFIGVRKYGHRDAEPAREDDFASTGQIGIAEIPRSALKPLEAQGRGFTHGHEKIISVPRTRAAQLKQLFAATATEHGEDELSRWCQQTRFCGPRALCNMILQCSLEPSSESHCDQNPSQFNNRSAAGSMAKWRRPMIARHCAHSLQ